MFKITEWMMENVFRINFEDTEQEYTKPMGIQAKLDGEGEDGWFNMGNVRHVDAAEEMARINDFDGIVHTKHSDSPVIFKHRVYKSVSWQVIPMRQDG